MKIINNNNEKIFLLLNNCDALTVHKPAPRLVVQISK